MSKHHFLSLIILLSFTLSINAQRVKRKGTTPMDVTNKSKNAKTPAYSIEQFKGKWQEVERISYMDTIVDFTDSIQLNFMENNKAETRTSGDNKMTMKGEAQIYEENTLMIAADEYMIKSADTAVIVLDDGEKYIHKLKKTKEFWYETLGKLSVTQSEFKYPVPFVLQDIMGKWMVYRRQAKPGNTTAPTKLLKYLSITEKTGDETAKGEITFYQSEKSETLPCTIKVMNTTMEVKAGTNSWSLSVYKADGKEFVFGDADVLLYYCKPL